MLPRAGPSKAVNVPNRRACHLESVVASVFGLTTRSTFAPTTHWIQGSFDHDKPAQMLPRPRTHHHLLETT